MPQSTGTPSSQRLSVLLADDTPDFRMLLRVALSRHGLIEVVGEAGNGAEAMQLVASLCPDVVLLDLAMPVMDGLQAAPLIRSSSPRTKIVILSGFSRDRMEAEALQAGAHAFLEKGVHPKVIVSKLLEVCGREEIANAVSDEGTTERVRMDAPELQVVGRSQHSSWDEDVDVLRAKVAAAVRNAPDLTSAFESFCDVVRGLVAFDRAAFAVAQGNDFRMAAVHGEADHLLPVGGIVPVGANTLEVLRGKKPFTVQDTATDAEDSTSRALFERGIRSYMTVPVVAAGAVHSLVGVSALRAFAFTEDDLRLLEAAVHEAAVAFQVLAAIDQERDAATKLNEVNELRLEWNRILRHDLRSPISVIGGFASMLQGNWNDLADAEKLEFVEAIVRNVRDMTKLLADTEVVDQIEQGAPVGDVQPFDLRILVEQALADASAGGRRSGSLTAADDLPLALGDEGKQRRVLSNLLDNAFKYSGDGQPVEVVLVSRDGMLYVSVYDGGAGIKAEDVPKLFRKFSRLDQPEGFPRVRGSGLGLYICKSLVEAQGGSIWVQSKPGAGTVFTYTVPVAEASDEQSRGEDGVGRIGAA